MRIKILADVKGGLTLPINYNHTLTGVIYHYLAESDPKYANFLHKKGYVNERKQFKLFTFSQLMAEHRSLIGDRIHFGSTLTWYVSSPVETFLHHFANTLLTGGTLNLGEHRLPIKNVNVPRTPRFQPQMRFRCLSPMVMTTVRERAGKRVMHYCLPDDPAFSDLVRQNLIRKHEVIHGRHPTDATFTLEFDKNYIARRHGRVTRLVDYKGVKIRGILCPLTISGSRALIQTGYECGFGDKNSAGFGMVEV